MELRSMSRLDRRAFLKVATVGAASLELSRAQAAWAESLPPVRTITRGPAHHWFGYYDKFQFDPANRFVLSNEVGFEHRTPAADDTIRVGMIDTADGDKWIELGTSGAWGWQQGCMLQWVPNSESDVMWNDRDGGQHVCRIMNVKTRELRTLPRPIYTVSPDGTTGLSINFARLQVFRPGYGYAGLFDASTEKMAPDYDGIFRVDMKSGESKLILPLSEMLKIPYKGRTLDDVWHWFNHLLVSPDGKRFIFLNRFRKWDPVTREPKEGFTTRMITANLDGSGVFVLDPSGETSHFIWRDPEYVCMWTKPEGKKAAFYLFRDRTREIEIVGENVMPVNGHNTYLPNTNNEWILNDTYPDKDRNQNVYLYHVPSGKRVELGHFHSPREYTGEWRCDTHPRASRDGKWVCIDSPHTGEGRQLHLIDIRGIVQSI
jgi:hypothetical protein